MHGGRRQNAGRPKGSRSKTSKRSARLLNAEAARGEIMPLEHMLKQMRNETLPMATRNAMAIAAAPFCHPRLAATLVQNNTPEPLPTNVTINIVPIERGVMFEADGDEVNKLQRQQQRRKSWPRLIENSSELIEIDPKDAA